jgi:hypothetical protein
MGCICEARRDTGVDVWWDSEPDAGCALDEFVLAERGEPDTEFRSGAIVGGRCLSDVFVALLHRKLPVERFAVSSRLPRSKQCRKR